MLLWCAETDRLGSFSRLTLAWRVFGRDRVNGEIRRIRSVPAGWGYRLGRDDDTLLPMVACQLFLLNRSPHVEALRTELFDRIRSERLLPDLRLNTLHAIQRAVAHLGLCDPPAPGTGRHSARASGGPQQWAQWVDRWHATSTLTPRACGSVRAILYKVGRWLEVEHPEATDPAAWTRQTCAAWVASRQVLARDAVCLLDVPTHKTGTAFTKPVDPILGQALDVWQAVRPDQPKFTDRRTGEQVDLLFAVRARKVSSSYINNTVIPMLCRKAGVPAADVRRNITSHRARSTIASQRSGAGADRQACQGKQENNG